MQTSLALRTLVIALGSLSVMACGGASGDDLLGDGAASDDAPRTDAAADVTPQDSSSFDTSSLDHSVPDTAVDVEHDVHHPKDAAHDVTPPIDSGSTFACGTKECLSGAEFCFLEGGSIATPDSGFGLKGSCHPVPKSCEPTPTCTCVEPWSIWTPSPSFCEITFPAPATPIRSLDDWTSTPSSALASGQ